MTFEERIKLEAKLALHDLVESRFKSEQQEDNQSATEIQESEDEEELEESATLVAGAVGATAAAVVALVNKWKKKNREKMIQQKVDELLPNVGRDITRLQQRAKLLNSAQDIDSFEKATGELISKFSTAVKEAEKIELTEKELNSLSWRITSPEARQKKFRTELTTLLNNAITEIQNLETIAMRELNARLGIDG